MNRIEDIVYYDFQGWPEYKMNLREVLVALGGKVEGNIISFDLNDPLMAVYPRILVDDGMGYGVDENVIVSVDADKDNSFINIFREINTVFIIDSEIIHRSFFATGRR